MNMGGSSSHPSNFSPVNMQVSTLNGSENMGFSSSSGSSSSRSIFKTTTKTKPVSTEEDTKLSLNSLNSLSSAGSKQRIMMSSGAPRDFSRQNFQRNYDARHGSDIEMNEISGFASGNQTEAVSVPNNPRVDLAKSTREIIRNRGKHQFVQDSVAGTSTSHDSSTLTSKEDYQIKKTTGLPAFLRVSFFFLLLLVLAAGIGVLIHFLRQYDSPDMSSTDRANMSSTDRATCTADDVEFGKNPTIVCNTTFKNISNISVVLTGPVTPGLIKLTSQNPDSNGWSLNFNKSFINLIGPPANCISGGAYNITIINNSTNTSLSTRITLAVNLYATDSGNFTLWMPSYNCSSIHCLQMEHCNASLLHIYSMDPSNSYCCESCLHLQNCTATCDVKFKSTNFNSKVNCTVRGT